MVFWWASHSNPIPKDSAHFPSWITIQGYKFFILDFKKLRYMLHILELILLNPFHGWNPHCFKSYPYFSGVYQLDTVFDKRSNLEWIASDADFSSIFRLNLGSIWSSKAWTPTAGRRWRCTMPAISCGSRFRPTRLHPPAPGVRPVAVSQGRLPSGNQIWKILHLKIIFPIKTFICKGFSVAMFDHRKATTKNHGRIKPSYGYMSDGI